jgi:hypothetical protein
VTALSEPATDMLRQFWRGGIGIVLRVLTLTLVGVPIAACVAIIITAIWALLMVGLIGALTGLFCLAIVMALLPSVQKTVSDAIDKRRGKVS